MDLLRFQIKASTQVVDRFIQYMDDPLTVTRTRIVPFYQNLSSITGSGKTVILADIIQQIRSRLPIEPIVLWLSKGKVVVWQTYANLSSGKYADLLSGYEVKPLLDCKKNDIEDISTGLVLVATVGKFNQKDKNEGDRKIFQVMLDSADESLWEMLKTRRDAAGRRRPFLVVYDEGHNLSDQQTELLLELEPDALIAASATIKVPAALSKTIDRLTQDKNWQTSDFVTVVKSSDVVGSGLVKKHIALGGYVTPMEIAIDEMFEDMKRANEAIEELHLSFRPKAIYVSNTNTVNGTTEKDNIAQPFDERQARPILIWRYLVEHKKVAPDDIAVYCNLKFDPKFPPPSGLNLFSGGDADYDNFIAGDYRHIIFNLTLQEGWDDPTCYFAYIDKDMGSQDQVTQVIGRVLRQPQAQHYPIPELNTAHFYIRTDAKNVFEQVLEEVEKKIIADTPQITLTVYKGGSGSGNRALLPAVKTNYAPEVSVNSPEAKRLIKDIVDKIQDYRQDRINTVGIGGRMQILQTIGFGTDAKEEWVEVDHNNRVTARWIFLRELQKINRRAINLCDIEDPKFDALIEYNSRAAEHMRDAANKVVDCYLDNSEVVQTSLSKFKIADMPVNPSSMTRYKYAIHEGYSGLNNLEKKFANAIDSTKKSWFRNPSKGCFEIPLLDKGGTNDFNPDFLVWVNKNLLIAIDTKGEHLINTDAGRKLFHIRKVGQGPDLLVRFITEGEWSKAILKLSGSGYTVWLLRNGKPHPIHCENVADAVNVALRVDNVGNI